MRVSTILILAFVATMLIGAVACQSDQDSGESNTNGADGWDLTGELPEGWPDDVPLMDGFSVKGSMSSPDTSYESDGFFVVASGSVDIYEAGDFYDNLPGWETESHRFSEDPYLVEEMGGDGMMVLCRLGPRSVMVMIKEVTEAEVDQDYVELGCTLGETVLSLTHVREEAMK